MARRPRPNKKTPKKIFSRKPDDADKIALKLAGVNLNAVNVKSESGPGPWPKFDDMKLDPNLLKGILAHGWEKPAPIQQRAIVPLARGKDVVLQAQSGMGKTAALCIGILQRINLKDRQNCQALVIAPTRELALQITEEFRQLSQYMGIKCMSSIGGTRTKIDKEKLSGGGYSIVVGTLGRILQLVKEKFILTDTIRMFALDEADKMLTDPSFKPDLCELIGKYIEGDAQIILMSATMPSLAVKRANEFMSNPEFFLINNEELTLEGIRQYHVNVDDEERKIETLFDLKAVIAEQQSLIFCNTRKRVVWLTEKLQARGLIFSSTHGEKDQSDRMENLKAFRSGTSRLIIASDLLGRGIDVQQVSLVVNFDLPDVTEYIHRVGRGGRFGRKGVAITFITNDQVDSLKEIAQFYNTEIPPMPANIFK